MDLGNLENLFFKKIKLGFWDNDCYDFRKSDLKYKENNLLYEFNGWDDIDQNDRLNMKI